MSRTKEEIIKEEYEKVYVEPHYEESVVRVMEREFIHSAMDIYFTEMAMELLEYMAKNEVNCTGPSGDDDRCAFFYKGGWRTKEELFQNFL